MEKRPPAGIVVAAVLFVAYGNLAFGSVVVKMVSSYRQLVSLMGENPGLDAYRAVLFNFYYLITGIVAPDLIALLCYIVAGIGLFMRRAWAYYMVFVLVSMNIVGIAWTRWLFGPQIIDAQKLFIHLCAFAIIAVFFTRKNVRSHFVTDGLAWRKLPVAARMVIILLVSLIALRIASIPLWNLYAKLKFKEMSSVLRLIPEKAEYAIRDKDFIEHGCSRRAIFDYQVRIPADWHIASVTKSADNMWYVSFVKHEGEKVAGYLMLDNHGQSYFDAIAAVLKFKSAFEFEKAVYLFRWSPLYVILKAASAARKLERIDELTTASWKGLIKVIYSPENGRKLFDCSLYDPHGVTLGNMILGYDLGLMNDDQAKSIIASLEFSRIPRDHKVIFEEGKTALGNNDYVGAVLNFVTVLSQDPNNKEYTFFLAKALSEDPAEDGKASRLRSSQSFMEMSDPALRMIP